ncbi:olfactory receptor 52H1-like [Protopterus annectens]|uniref:olfactory receptor 52H1-like n=1 Tax=Protopterus annectens TaxID=7888 RepID=UPI001CFAFFC8|nr:olfactory receptor 52H1-like [Protopterus annectens]
MPNTTCSTGDNLEIVLVGFLGLHDIQHWLSIPFFIMFLMSFFGNLIILLIIATEQRLHEPMYYFIFMLSAADLVLAVSLLPKLLVVLWYGSILLNFNGCLAQLFVIAFSSAMESSILALMAYDRYIAVTKSLRYRSIIKNQFILRISLFVTVRNFCIILPLPVLAKILPYYRVTTMYSVYCDYLAVSNAACAQTAMSEIYKYIFIIIVAPSDIALIGLSYFKIARAVLKLDSREARQKAFNTCSSHIFVMVVFYLSGFMSIIRAVYDGKAPKDIPVLFSVLYITVPTTLNPLIYGIKTKEIRQVILKYLRKC